ncbi:proline racemase family protein [Colwellia sp. Bg11-28]|jgi:trans-L-3-hydroxyproline dehydratase|uniref:proline racemase family protein n=1 Tax=Colwellia sp. Bg11-28 TaxID=2058305 RepID=UPI000C32365F|nr:proline racemase family protein [Colwellia sp. Bg11-28]PKH88691.1 proline racemase [Colwellia sp. Bg11-28]
MTKNIAQAAVKFEQWQPKIEQESYLTINSLECHTGGEPLRIITSGFPVLKGNTILAKANDCKQNYDQLRRALMFEPRGHADMYGAIITGAERDDSHFGAVFIHNEGYSSMCGHAVIALTKTAVESGVVARTGDVTQVVIDVPCGQIYAMAYSHNNVVKHVSFQCVPSFVYAKDQQVEVDGIGMVQFDIAYGGAFYAYVQASSLGLSLVPEQQEKLIAYGRKIKQAIIPQFEINHPTTAELSFLYGVIFIDDSPNQDVHSRNVCIFADGELDRSPTGSGVSGRIALHHAKQQIVLNETITIESILASSFSVRAIETVCFAGFDAVIPEVTGDAYVCGKGQWFINAEDPLKYGFLLR